MLRQVSQNWQEYNTDVHHLTDVQQSNGLWTSGHFWDFLKCQYYSFPLLMGFGRTQTCPWSDWSTVNLFVVPTENSTVRKFPCILRGNYLVIKDLLSLTKDHTNHLDVVRHTSNLHRIPPYLGLGRAGSEIKGFVGPRKQMSECWSLKFSELEYTQSSHKVSSD